MNARYCTAALALIVGLILSNFVTVSNAASPTLLIAPGEPYGLPKFGFSSSNVGFGEQVVFVRPGSRAARLGLEPGDVILSLNGYRLSYTGSWNDALSRAVYDGGLVQLRVRDVRTGLVHLRQTYVNSGGGPVIPYYRSGITVSPQPYVVPRSSGITIRTTSRLFE